MLQRFDAVNNDDENGNPAGGTVQLTTHYDVDGMGYVDCPFYIKWQDGPLAVDGVRKEPTGAFVETVIAAALQRIEYYNTAAGGKFRCRENSLAITHLEEALHWLNHRTAAREARGVEGTHTA